MTIRYIVHAERRVMRLQGDRVEDEARGGGYEYGTHDTLEAAVAEVRELAADPETVSAHRTRYGVGSIEHMVYTVDASVYDEMADGWEPCMPDGTPPLDWGTEPAYTHDVLDDHPELERAFRRAVAGYHKFLDYEDDAFGSLFDYLPEDRDQD